MIKDFNEIGGNRDKLVAEIFKVISHMKKSRETSEQTVIWSRLSSEHKKENYSLNDSANFQSEERVSINM
jgi:hypothetical protein